MLTVDDFCHQRAAAAAAGGGPADVANFIAAAGAALHAGSDFAVGDTVTVTYDHRGESEDS